MRHLSTGWCRRGTRQHRGTTTRPTRSRGGRCAVKAFSTHVESAPTRSENALAVGHRPQVFVPHRAGHFHHHGHRVGEGHEIRGPPRFDHRDAAGAGEAGLGDDDVEYGVRGVVVVIPVRKFPLGPDATRRDAVVVSERISLYLRRHRQSEEHCQFHRT